MPAVTLKAHFDGRQIVLDEAFGLQTDAQLLVTVLPMARSDLDLERSAWAQLATESLSRAFGDAEPEYGEVDVKERV